jgi:dTDP-4-dehydrorhamnose 3,5-epimerase
MIHPKALWYFGVPNVKRHGERIRKMGKITVETCGIEGLKVITPTVFGDARGYFMETYHYNDYKAAGIDVEFVQDNQSASKKGVLRGLHFQKEFPQDKLVRVIKGEVFDVAVDLRQDSPTFGQWYGVLLSEGTDYTYNAANGEFATVSGRVTVPAATVSQDSVSGVWVTTPGVGILRISGTV